jgi:hypothetical protein
MKRLTKKLVRELLSGDYLTALAFFANRFEKYDDIANDFDRKCKLSDALDKLDWRMWELCEEIDDSDYTEMWLRILSALRCAC